MTHYDVLGIRPDASQEQIEIAYKKREQSGAIKQAYRAYWWLRDPERRKQYDDSLKTPDPIIVSQSDEKEKRSFLRNAAAAALLVLGIGLIWLLVSSIHWLWTHPLF